MLNNNLPIDIWGRGERACTCRYVCCACVWERARKTERAIMCSIVHFPFCRAFVLHLTHWHNDYCCACVHNKHEWFSAISSFNASCEIWWQYITFDGHARDPIHQQQESSCSIQLPLDAVLINLSFAHTHTQQQPAHCSCYRKWLRVFSLLFSSLSIRKKDTFCHGTKVWQRNNALQISSRTTFFDQKSN